MENKLEEKLQEIAKQTAANIDGQRGDPCPFPTYQYVLMALREALRANDEFLG